MRIQGLRNQRAAEFISAAPYQTAGTTQLTRVGFSRPASQENCSGGAKKGSDAPFFPACAAFSPFLDALCSFLWRDLCHNSEICGSVESPPPPSATGCGPRNSPDGSRKTG